jgi:hypothetical protein
MKNITSWYVTPCRWVEVYCRVFMAAWPRITDFRLDDWIYLQLLLKSLVITIIYKTHKQSSAEPCFLNCRGLAPFSFSFYDWTTYVVSRRIQRKHICCPAMDIWEPQRKHLFCCQECVFIDPLPCNGSTCHIIDMLEEYTGSKLLGLYFYPEHGDGGTSVEGRWPTRIHSVISQKLTPFIVTAVNTWDRT